MNKKSHRPDDEDGADCAKGDFFVYSSYDYCVHADKVECFLSFGKSVPLLTKLSQWYIMQLFKKGEVYVS